MLRQPRQWGPLFEALFSQTVIAFGHHVITDPVFSNEFYEHFLELVFGNVLLHLAPAMPCFVWKPFQNMPELGETFELRGKSHTERNVLNNWFENNICPHTVNPGGLHLGV